MSTDTISINSRSMTDLDEDQFQEAVEQGVFEAYRIHEYVKVDDEGDEALDKTALHQAIYKAVSGAIVNDPKERSERSLTRGDLAKKVFPHTPGSKDEWDQLDPVQKEVWEKVVRDAWNPTNPNYSGPVQRLVGERDDKTVLVKTKTTVGGTPSVDVVYLTSSEELIFSDFIGPMKSSVRRAAERLAKNAALVSSRNNDLAAKASREVDSGMKAAASLAKSTLDLMSGTSGS